ncbi:MAG: GNAT family N-acetyltransferase [Paludibacterium sp.]|uniref:GNAT family N-acetyltransferase n=1 Tax=Paludibacterium sp. TaxID=1917523 RepID=UPI0025EE18B8|nr:GNAT family N-acetyltransferase [Paludibacterium sp.]MBV8046861.1 GNAT family N-acetyltransferase [Paludibacterium sp.]MBV8647161.1 GNAT family N-acetyltransferase [Paludibacterium sp.]
MSQNTQPTALRSIRPVRSADWPALETLFLDARRQAFHWQSPERFLPGDLRQQTDGETLWVAEMDNGRLGGFVSVWTEDDFIHHLFIAPDLQGRGIGRALLGALPDWGRRRYTLKCLAQNVPALSFYAAQGFHAQERGHGEDGDYWLLAHPAKADHPAGTPCVSPGGPLC